MKLGVGLTQTKETMQVTPLSQLYIIPSETPIPVIAGTLTDISQHKTGVSSMGQWAFQRAKLNDGQTQVQVVFKDRPAVSPALQGRRVYIQSTNGHGLKAKDDFDKRKNTTQRVAWVTGTAVIEVADGNGQPAPQQALQQQPVQQAFVTPQVMQRFPEQPPSPYAPAPHVPAQPLGELVQRGLTNPGPKSVIGRLARIHSWCVKAAIQEASILMDEEPMIQFETDNVLQVAACLFIDARKQLGLDGVPNIFDPREAKTQAPPPPPPVTQVANTEPEDPWKV